MQRQDEYDVYEVKYLSSPLSNAEMRKEEKQINMIKGIKIGKIGFVSVSGFEVYPDKYDLISGDDLYE